MDFIGVEDTDDIRIDSLLSNRKWQDNIITYSFFDGGIYYSDINLNTEPFTEKMKQNTRFILEEIYESYINVDFVEVEEEDDNEGTIRFLLGNKNSTAFGYYPSNFPSGGDIILSTEQELLLWFGDRGEYGFYTIIHEVGHSLGLKHPGNYDPTDEPPYLEGDRDNLNNTVMTYNIRAINGDSTYESGEYPSTPMLYDILTLQYLYGAREYNITDTTYTFDTVSGMTNGSLYLGDPQQQTQILLWDSGGIDTLDLSQLSSENSGYHFDIKPGGILTTKNSYLARPYRSVGESTGEIHYATDRGTVIAYKVIIENVLGTSSQDLVLGNKASNQIKGDRGNDTIKGAGSKDIIYLQTGKDRGFGGRGNDLLYGGNNDDYLVGNSGKDRLIGGQGNDLILGTEGDDTLQGGRGKDTLQGGNGNDRLNGSRTMDFYDGGNGFDTVVLRNVESKAIVNLANNKIRFPHQKSNTIINIEKVIGSSFEDILIGDDRNNSILGYLGNDFISLGGGSDRAMGGEGNDTINGTNNINAGAFELDILYGESGEDLFILGNKDRVYYIADKNKDLAKIKDFNPLEDRIQLSGDRDNYQLREFNARTKIFWQNELIGILENTTNLSLDSEEFVFI